MCGHGFIYYSLLYFIIRIRISENVDAGWFIQPSIHHLYLLSVRVTGEVGQWMVPTRNICFYLFIFFATRNIALYIFLVGNIYIYIKLLRLQLGLDFGVGMAFTGYINICQSKVLIRIVRQRCVCVCMCARTSVRSSAW